MSMSVWNESSPVWVDPAGDDLADGITPGQWRRFVAWRLGGDGAALVDGYEQYVPVKRIVVPLEAAATSPFMDA